MTSVAPGQRTVPFGEVGRWRWHLDTGALVWDDACARLHGALPGEDPVAALRRVIHPSDARRLDDRGLWSRHEVLTFRVLGGGTAPRYLVSRLTAVEQDAEGTPDPGWVSGVTIDVTASTEATTRAVAALRDMTDGFLTLDDAFRVTYLNTAAEAVLHRGHAEVVGRRLWEAVPLVLDSAVEDACRRAAATDGVVTVEWGSPRSSRWVTVDVHPCAEGLNLYFRDTTERHRAAVEQQRLLQELEHRATHDALTGLVNAASATQLLREHLASGPRATASLVCLDLDRFSLVNDTLGHSTGDRLLMAVASRLTRLVPPGAVLARTSGDEFAVVLLDATASAVEELAGRALAAVREPLRVDRQELHVTASAGLARSRAGRGEADLVRDADIALHEAKRTGRDRHVWCDGALQDGVASRVAVERDLREALTGGEQLALHYQPSFSLSTGLPTGVEALLRWQHPRRGLVPPAGVIPVAEESGLILPLGDWVMACAARQAVTWAQVPDLTVWVNVAPRQLAAGDVAGTLMGVLAATGLPPDRLGIEVTESVLADGCPASAALEDVRRLGIRIAIDDFGTGYSSLSRLLAFPVDVVKIDRSFVTASHTRAGRAVIEGVVNLAHGIGASVIAEGVETWEQLEVLRATPCDAVTGFLLGRPVPAAEQGLARARLSPGLPAPRQRDGAGRAARAPSG